MERNKCTPSALPDKIEKIPALAKVINGVKFIDGIDEKTIARYLNYYAYCPIEQYNDTQTAEKQSA